MKKSRVPLTLPPQRQHYPGPTSMLCSCYCYLPTAMSCFDRPLRSELDPKCLLVQGCGLDQWRRKEEGSLKEPP